MIPITNRHKTIIHVAKQQTGLTEPEYRDLLASVGVKSSSDLDIKKYETVMSHFKKLGFKIKKKPSPLSRGDRGGLAGKINALLADMRLPDSYADGIAKQMFSIDKYNWCSPDQLRRIVAALVYKQQKVRAGLASAQ